MTEMSESEWCSGADGELQDEGARGWYVRRAHDPLAHGVGPMASPTRIVEVGAISASTARR